MLQDKPGASRAFFMHEMIKNNNPAPVYICRMFMGHPLQCLNQVYA